MLIIQVIAIFTVESVAFSLTSGFHAETLRAFLKVKTSRPKPIFLFTDTCNNDVLSRPQSVINWVFKQAGLNTVSYRKGWNLPQAGLTA